MELERIAIRAIATYGFLLVMLRLSGKRAVLQCTPFDFVLALILGDIVDDAVWAEVPFAHFIVATGTLCVAKLLTEIADFHSPALARLVQGRPVLVVSNGEQRVDGMRKTRLREEDLEHLLRIEGLDRNQWHNVRSAWIEVDGSLSALRTDEAEDARKKDQHGQDEEG
jgi:uncharacterized membrane protein YcaP (DUF421 family)